MTATIAQMTSIPTPGTPVQSQELGPTRWVYYRAYIAGKSTAIANLIGALSEDDDSRFEDGTLDVEFEETHEELLSQLEKESREQTNMIARFRHNLVQRPKDPIPPT